ncbi:MAG: YIEGIA family protein [Paenibacillaceae bacterium]
MFALLQSPETLGIVIGISFGVISRLLMLRTDYRQYPTYPHGRIIHISLGVIAAALGAIVIPALLTKNYTAVTFLSLAAQQFREVRSMERKSLAEADKMDLVPRGTSYIEGIAMVFEGRNYLVIFSSFVASFCSIIFSWYWGIAAGILSLFITKKFQSGKNLWQIADIRIGKVRVDGPDVFVDSIYIMNVGLKENQQMIRQHGFGLIVLPKTKSAKITIANLGQRQAILHNLSTILGVYRDSGEPALIPMAKLDLNSGELAVFILPQEKDAQKAIEALKRVPVLETAVRLPSA